MDELLTTLRPSTPLIGHSLVRTQYHWDKPRARAWRLADERFRSRYIQRIQTLFMLARRKADFTSRRMAEPTGPSYSSFSLRRSQSARSPLTPPTPASFTLEPARTVNQPTASPAKGFTFFVTRIPLLPR